MYDIPYEILCIFHIDFFAGNVFGSVTGNVLRNRVHTLQQAYTGLAAILRLRELRDIDILCHIPHFGNHFTENKAFFSAFYVISNVLDIRILLENMLRFAKLILYTPNR